VIFVARLRSSLAPAALALSVAGMQALAQDAPSGAPLSAIDWLSNSVQTPAAAPDRRQAGPEEPPVSDGVRMPDVQVMPLDAPSPDRIGLLPPARTGLPRDLWARSDVETLVTLLRAERVEAVPAMQSLLLTLLLAEAEPPLGATPAGRLFTARIDKLLDLGTLDPALAMLEQADPDTPALFGRWFDVSLLTGTETAACTALQSKPEVAPTYAARIFCLARSGDWNAAALTLGTARALGALSEADEALLARFLDPELSEGDATLPPPARPDPLVFRLREAIGEPLPTAPLPRAFAHADLRGIAGWKAQAEAAERLARSGAIPANLWLGTMTENRPAASGGVWDRIAAIQDLAGAIDSGDTARIGAALRPAWQAAQEAGTEAVFAEVFGPDLAGLDLPGAAEPLALRIALLSPDYEAAARAASPEGDAQTDADRFLVALAQGDLSGQTPRGPRQAAVTGAFTGAVPVPPGLLDLAADGKLGEALLRAIALFNEGVDSDPEAVAEALAFFRSVALEDTARRAALQYLILDPRS